jgi:hypothetical protein
MMRAIIVAYWTRNQIRELIRATTGFLYPAILNLKFLCHADISPIFMYILPARAAAAAWCAIPHSGNCVIVT